MSCTRHAQVHAHAQAQAGIKLSLSAHSWDDVFYACLRELILEGTQRRTCFGGTRLTAPLHSAHPQHLPFGPLPSSPCRAACCCCGRQQILLNTTMKEPLARAAQKYMLLLAGDGQILLQRASALLHRASALLHRASALIHRASAALLHRASALLYRASALLHRASAALLHRASAALLHRASAALLRRASALLQRASASFFPQPSRPFCCLWPLLGVMPVAAAVWRGANRCCCLLVAVHSAGRGAGRQPRIWGWS